jgi:MFS transporter, PPP family, 3-phenylpropionic acid transporter
VQGPSRGNGHAAWTLRILYFAIGLWTASIGPFITVILHGRGFDSAAIGLVSACSALAVIVVVPVWGHVADVLVGRARAFRIGLIVAAVAAVVLLLPLPPAAVVTSLASFAIFIGLFNSLSDALAVDALAEPERQYGSLRALSSLSFTAAVIAVGFVYNAVGYDAAPYVSLVWSGLLFVLVGRVTDRTNDSAVRLLASSHGGDDAAGRFGSVSRAFAVQPRLLAVLAVLMLAYSGLQGAVTFVSIRIVELGGQPSDVALSFGISALAEIPGLVVASWLGRRIGLRWLTALSLIGYGLCVASWGFLPTPTAINATRLATGFCFGSFTAARVLLVSRLLPRPLQATGQGLVQAATVGIGTVLGTALGGIQYGWLGPTGFFLIAATAAIVGGLGTAVVLSGPIGDADDSLPVPDDGS